MPKPPSLKISVSGVRGIIGESLTPQLVTSFAAAFGAYCRGGQVVIGTDTRPSREMVSQATIAGLLSVGSTPVHLGIVPVPVLQLFIRTTGASGGICVTASHNPMEWNAPKLFGPDGVTLRPNQCAELTDMYHQSIFPRVSALKIADVRDDDSAIECHCEAVLRHLEVEAIRKKRFNVVVDCCNGAAFRAAPEFLRKLGLEVVALHANPDEPFPRDPEPITETIGALCRKVRQTGADLGFALDADADRLSLVDERGESLGEEYTLALAVRHELERNPGPVVVSMSTSRMVDDLAAAKGCPVFRSKVGEINVVDLMLEKGAGIGGEGNGGVIVPSINTCRDSFVAMAFVLESLAQEGGRLSGLCDPLTSYAMVKEKLNCRSRHIAPCIRLLRYHFRGEEMELTDGVKILWPDRWLHVRGSNTEPVIRIIAEASSKDEARAMVEGVLEYLRPMCR